MELNFLYSAPYFMKKGSSISSKIFLEWASPQPQNLQQPTIRNMEEEYPSLNGKKQRYQLEENAETASANKVPVQHCRLQN